MYRNPSTQALDILYQNFPREALVLFSDTFREAFISGEKMIVLPRGSDIGAIKKIFAWIKQCISEASLVDFEEASTTGMLPIDADSRFSTTKKPPTPSLATSRSSAPPSLSRFLLATFKRSSSSACARSPSINASTIVVWTGI